MLLDTVFAPFVKERPICVMARSMLERLLDAQRLTTWIKHYRHLPERPCFPRLHARLRGHDNYDGVRGHARALTRFLRWGIACTFKWRNRRGGKQRRDTWEQCPRVLDRVKRARPCITEVKRRSGFA